MNNFNIELKKNEIISNSTITTFETILEDEKMNKDIIETIDKQGDRQNYKTNVKAQMTEWNMKEQQGFKQLSFTILQIVTEISLHKYNIKINPFINDMWGLKYKSNDLTISHDHWPALWSCVYYINPPLNSPGLFFTEANIEKSVQHGLLIFFEGHVKHEVKQSKYEGYRYVVSANIHNRI
jgi:hypothetical protein